MRGRAEAAREEPDAAYVRARVCAHGGGAGGGEEEEGKGEGEERRGEEKRERSGW